MEHIGFMVGHWEKHGLFFMGGMYRYYKKVLRYTFFHMWVSFYSICEEASSTELKTDRTDRLEIPILDSVFIIPNIQRQGPRTEEDYKLCLEAQSKANLS